MNISTNEVLKYKNFTALASDVLLLAKQIMPDKIIYINSLNDETQVTLKVSEHNTKVTLEEGTVIPVETAICFKIDYNKGEPLVFEDIRGSGALKDIQDTVDALNVNAYLGVPIILSDGKRFGTLCAAHHEAQMFDDKEILLLKKIANMFSYYLELEYKAYRDALTGLYNYQYLHQTFTEMALDGGVMMMLDLDQFKQINDRFGHLMGNQILQQLAGKLTTFTAKDMGATSFRLGGDEFLVILPHLISIDTLDSKLKRLLVNLTQWENIEDMPLSASIGVVFYSNDSTNELETLLKKADQALYQAKVSGKNTYIIYAI